MKFSSKMNHGGGSRPPYSITREMERWERQADRKIVRQALHMEARPRDIGDPIYDPDTEFFPVIPEWIDADLA